MSMYKVVGRYFFKEPSHFLDEEDRNFYSREEAIEAAKRESSKAEGKLYYVVKAEASVGYKPEEKNLEDIPVEEYE